MTNSIALTKKTASSDKILPAVLMTTEAPKGARSVDRISSVGGSNEVRSESIAQDPLAGLEAPKGLPLTKEEFETLYQVLAQLGILYKLQMLNFNSTMDTLSVQGKQLREVAAEAKKHAERAAEIQKKIEKETAEERDVGKQIEKKLPELMTMMVIGFATGGVAGLVAAGAVGILFIGLDIKDKDGVSAWDKMTKELNVAINDTSKAFGGKEMTPETQRIVNIGIKVGASVALGAGTGAVVGKVIAKSAQAGAKLAQGSKQAATASGKATARSGAAQATTRAAGTVARPSGVENIRGAIRASERAVAQMKELGKRLLTRLERTQAGQAAGKGKNAIANSKGGKVAARIAGGVKEKMRKPWVRGTAIGIQIALTALEKWTSIEGIKDPESDEDNIAVRRETAITSFVRAVNSDPEKGQPLTASEMAEADKKGEALQKGLTGTLMAIKMASSLVAFAGPAGGATGANSLISIQNLMILAGIYSGVANGTEQLTEAQKQVKLAEWTAELAGVSSKQQGLRGEMVVGQNLQQMLNQDVVAMMTENGQRMQVIYGMLDSLNQTIPTLLQG
jgi:hypothetical protein